MNINETWDIWEKSEKKEGLYRKYIKHLVANCHTEPNSYTINAKIQTFYLMIR